MAANRECRVRHESGNPIPDFRVVFHDCIHWPGLGLSAVLGVLREHRGTLKVYRKCTVGRGKGMVIKVLFPIATYETMPVDS